jgi:hypothetical protein
MQVHLHLNFLLCYQPGRAKDVSRPKPLMVLTDLSLRLGGHGDVAEGEGGGDGEHRVALRLIVGH